MLNQIQQNQLINQGWLQWKSPAKHCSHTCQAMAYQTQLILGNWYLFYRCQCCQEITIRLRK